MSVIKPAALIAVCASPSVLPVTSGTTTVGEPLETISAIGEPAGSGVPMAGSVRMARPFSTVALASAVIVTTKFYGELLSNCSAADETCPSIFGILLPPVPPDTTTEIGEPERTCSFASGSCVMI